MANALRRTRAGVCVTMAILVGVLGGWVLADAAQAATAEEAAGVLSRELVFVAPGAEAVDTARLAEGFGGPPAATRLAVLAEAPAEGARGFADRVLETTGGTVLVFTPEEIEVSSAVATDRQVESALSTADDRADPDDVAGYALAFDESLNAQLEGGVGGLLDGTGIEAPSTGTIVIGVIVVIVVLMIIGRVLRGFGRLLGGGRRRNQGYGGGYRRSRSGGMGWLLGGFLLGNRRRRGGLGGGLGGGQVGRRTSGGLGGITRQSSSSTRRSSTSRSRTGGSSRSRGGSRGGGARRGGGSRRR
jgi:hypothetical protein